MIQIEKRRSEVMNTGSSGKEGEKRKEKKKLLTFVQITQCNITLQQNIIYTMSNKYDIYTTLDIC